MTRDETPSARLARAILTLGYDLAMQNIRAVQVRNDPRHRKDSLPPPIRRPVLTLAAARKEIQP